MELDGNKIVDNLIFRISQLTKQVAILEVENLTLKELIEKKEIKK